MHLSDAGQRDPSMLGSSQYPRNALDFYPTPKRAVDALLSVIGDDLPSWLVWEPFCGNGAISTVIKPDARDIVSTDIRAYDGFDPDGLFDFFKIKTTSASLIEIPLFDPTGQSHGVIGHENRWVTEDGTGPTMADIANLKGFMPDVILSNPPYGDDAEKAARHALALMEPQKGMVIFLCRHEWDTAKGRADLFDHPAFAMKIVLRHRPRWIEGSKGAPRHSYAWYVWSWTRPALARPEIFYAA